MSELHQDGFDGYYDIADMLGTYTSVTGYVAIDHTLGRYGATAITQGDNQNGAVLLTLPSVQTDIWTGFAFNCQSNTATGAIFGLFSPAGNECYITYNSGVGSFELIGSNNSVLASGVSNLNLNVWHWIEIHTVAGTSGGAAEVWVDGVRKLIYNGNLMGTSGSMATTIAAVSIAGVSAAFHLTVAGYYDDLYVNNNLGLTNNGRIGDSRIDTLLPVSDAGPNNGTPSSGSSHFAMVDEATSDYAATTLTLTNTVGQEECFHFAPLIETPSIIFAVRVINVAQKTDAGPCSIAGKVYSGASNAVGTGNPVVMSYTNEADIFEADPSTSAPWTYTAINAIKAGCIIITP